MSYTKWVAGLLFNTKGELALILKTHPVWQAGKLNGIGGKIDEGESALLAMQREFKEESGADVADWKEFALLKVQDGQVHFFVAHGDYEIKSMTDERVEWIDISSHRQLPLIQNLAWLIPLALDKNNPYTTIDYFQTDSAKG
ncbi:MAG TPA: NUDIX domain-containing protein [Candidatus Paceibacterota bacterium]|nr:NUDIX domain-containing protein [Candidatus Paceibacterota bacterium]